MFQAFNGYLRKDMLQDYEKIKFWSKKMRFFKDYDF